MNSENLVIDASFSSSDTTSCPVASTYIFNNLPSFAQADLNTGIITVLTTAAF